MPALHHLLLGLSVAALLAAGVRGASMFVPRGIERVLVAATFATAAAVVESLALGLLALGGSTAALTLAAAATWVVTRAVLPPPETPALRELGGWWRERTPAQRAGLGTIAGGLAAWTASQLRHPELGIDTIVYHLPEMAMWVQQGTPGSIEVVTSLVPVGNLPLTAEVSTAWAMGISRSLVPVVLSIPVAVALTAVAGSAGLRTVRVPPLARVLAVAAFCTSPWFLAWMTQGAMTDPPALAWLVACAALCAASARNPALFPPAVVAGGLSVGCKTTTLPIVAVVLALGLWAVRGEARRLLRALAVAAVVAGLVGGVWYVRNLVAHGSPFWPFEAAPWGDPVPRRIAAVDTNFYAHAGRTIERLGDAYLAHFCGSLVLLVGGLLAPLLAPRRRVAMTSMVGVCGFLVWAAAPQTGVDFGASRYLLPVVGVATLALAMAASKPGRVRVIPAGLLAAAAVVNVVQTLDLGYPDVPSPFTVLVGVVAGALLALAVGRSALGRLPSDRGRLAPAAAAAAVAVGSAALAIPASGFVRRHASLPGVTTTPSGRRNFGGVSPTLLVKWLTSQARYTNGDPGVTSSPIVIGPLAGDRLTHRLSFVAADDPCAVVAARSRGAWLVVSDHPPGLTTAQVTRCFPGAKPVFRDRLFVAFPPRP